MKCTAICIGGTDDHIHILYLQNKTMALSDVVRVVKTNSSKWINEQNGASHSFRWQDGYGAFSISNSNSNSHVDAVIKYIQNQEDHHKKVSFQDELRKICQQCGVEYDERYVWE